jgi:DNA polymerase I
MYELVTDIKGIGNFQSALSKAESISFDTETNGLDFFRSKVILMQAKVGDTIYVFDVRKLGDKLSKYVVQLLKDCGKTLIGHNLKFDMKMVFTNFGELFTNVCDTMIAEILITNGLAKGEDRYFSLADLTEKHCNITLDKSVRSNFYSSDDPIITEQELVYAALDVLYLEEILKKQLKTIELTKQTKVFDLEMNLLPVICKMELEGVLLDKDLWLKLGGDSVKELEHLRKELVDEMFEKVMERRFNNALELVDLLKITEGAKTKKDRKALEEITDVTFVIDRIKEMFNLNSNTQMETMLKDIYGIPIENTNEKTINKYELGNPIITKILKYRELAKNISTYGDKFLSSIHPETGRIHTEFNQLGMVSGRISSSKPNLQNIKRESEYRSAFIARPGYKIISIDFSQEELRLLAVIAQVKGMIEAYNNNIDLHLKTGAELFEVPLDQVTKEQRRIGKTMNFAVGYGSTEYGLFKNFGIPMDKGREYLDKFYGEVYPEILAAKNGTGKLILDLGWSTTLLGRKRFFERKVFFPGGIREKEKLEAAIIREGFNHIVQGTGAEILKQSLIRIDSENPFGDGLKLLLQVYDEIVCEVAEEIADEALSFISKIMLECETVYLKGIVPAEVDGKISNCWLH